MGKYSECFLQMILGQSSKRCPHAIHGAALASQAPLRSQQVAYAIAGHHAGMPDRADLTGKILEHLSTRRDYLESARLDCPDIRAFIDGPAIKLEDISSRADVITRMLFSCLVDADRLDTGRRPNVQAPLRAEERLKKLLSHIATLHSGSQQVNEARREVLVQCFAAAETPDRLLSLSVPTGGGKTLAAMALALKRASIDPNYRRSLSLSPIYRSLNRTRRCTGAFSETTPCSNTTRAISRDCPK